MSDNQSSARNIKKASSDTTTDTGDRVLESASGEPPLQVNGDQPTVISNHPPIAAPLFSDSVHRIMEGRIMPGDHLAHFELVEYVGGGGMGRVFRAIDIRLDRTVALKILAPDQTAEQETLQRFQNEAQSCARLDHDNIARVYYVGEDRGVNFIVFEFVEGENLRKLLERKGPLPLGEAVSYTLQVAEALAHADARQVVHRDIKPSNVLITPGGFVKVIDMGLARLRQADSAQGDLTASGVTLGTFDYIAPEQARDPRNADVRSDIYSLGCTFYFMLTGQPPFPEGTVLQKLLQHQGDPPPDVREFRPDLPQEANRVLQKMMAKEPDRRYLDPGELVADLLLLAEQVGLQHVILSGSSWLPMAAPKVSFIQRHLPGLVALAALVCIVLVLDVYWRISTPVNPPTVVADSGPIASESALLMAQSPVKSAVGASPIDWLNIGSGQSDMFLKNGDNAPLALDDLQADSSRTAAQTTSSSAEADKNVLSADINLPQKGVLIVSNPAAGENQFSSLAAACAAAHNGDVIELRYNGRQDERPIRLANLQLTIRAAEGFQPLILFRPNETDPVKYPRSMFSLSSGRLMIFNIAIELDVPRDMPADNWSLLEIRGGQTVRLEKCLLTIANASDQLTAYHQDVAFFRVGASPGAEAVVAGDKRTAPPLASIELSDTIARGEAVLLHIEDLQPVHLAWNNGLLATSERLLTAKGGAQSPKPDEMLRLDLRHVTVMALGGLARLASSQAAPYLFTVQLNCTDNIFMTSPGISLIEQEVIGPLENARRQIVWNGDHNFYQDIEAFWTIHSLDAQPPADTLKFEGWQKYWGGSRENRPFFGRIQGRKLPGAERPCHAQTPTDYALDEASLENPALGTASDSQNAGMKAKNLPDFIEK